MFYVFAIAALLLSGFYYGYQKADAQEPFLSSADFGLKQFRVFWETWTKLKQEYVEPEKVQPDKAAFEAARGLVKSLGDPYSDLFTPAQGKILEGDLSGGFCGVGMEIGERKGLITVIAPLDGTPAQKAGLKAGDTILKINDEDATALRVEEAVAQIRGECGVKVKLNVMRENWKAPKDFEIARAKIEVPAVKSSFYKPNIGYIKLTTFNPKTVPEFALAYDNLKKQGAKKYILDLRNNPGGFLEVAISLSELFLERGQVAVKELWGGKKAEKSVFSEGPGTLRNLKMVILINKGSASASEIFTGALRDNLAIKVLGEKSFGKGSIQQIFQIEDNLLKLTVGYWLTPKGQRLEGKGIEPDVKLEDPNLDDEKDEVLDKAIEYIKKI